jgi:hypothetical protein
MVEERRMDLVEVLGFLFMLGSLELGRVSYYILISESKRCTYFLLF